MHSGLLEPHMCTKTPLSGNVESSRPTTPAAGHDILCNALIDFSDLYALGYEDEIGNIRVIEIVLSK